MDKITTVRIDLAKRISVQHAGKAHRGPRVSEPRHGIASVGVGERNPQAAARESRPGRQALDTVVRAQQDALLAARRDDPGITEISDGIWRTMGANVPPEKRRLPMDFDSATIANDLLASLAVSRTGRGRSGRWRRVFPKNRAPTPGACGAAGPITDRWRERSCAFAPVRTAGPAEEESSGGRMRTTGRNVRCAPAPACVRMEPVRAVLATAG